MNEEEEKEGALMEAEMYGCKWARGLSSGGSIFGGGHRESDGGEEERGGDLKNSQSVGF